MPRATARAEEELKEKEREGETPVIYKPEMGKIGAILASVDSLKECVCENEDDPIRKSEVIMGINKVMRFYKEFYEKKAKEKKQSLITKFLNVPGSSTNEPDVPDVLNEGEENMPIDSDNLFNEDDDGSNFEGFCRDVAAAGETAPSNDGAESR